MLLMMSFLSTGTFASDRGVQSSDTTLRWATGDLALTAVGGADPELPIGWGTYRCKNDGFAECLSIPKPECNDDTCDLVAHLLIERKINSYVRRYPSAYPHHDASSDLRDHICTKQLFCGQAYRHRRVTLTYCLVASGKVFLRLHLSSRHAPGSVLLSALCR